MKNIKSHCLIMAIIGFQNKFYSSGRLYALSTVFSSQRFSLNLRKSNPQAMVNGVEIVGVKKSSSWRGGNVCP